MTYPLDTPVRITFRTYSDAARTTLADPTALTIAIKGPDGALVGTYHWPTPAEVTRDSLGTFHYDPTGLPSGQYLVHGAATGAVATSYDDTFTVEPQFDPTLVSLTEVKQGLNYPTSTVDDDEIRRYLRSASATVEEYVGACIPRTVTQRFAYRRKLYPSLTPVLAVTSVTDNISGVVMDPTDYRINDLGYAVELTPTASHRFPLNLTLVYTAGRNPVPEPIRDATTELVRIRWQNSQQASPVGAGLLAPGETPEVAPRAAYIGLPPEIMVVLKPYAKPPVG